MKKARDENDYNYQRGIEDLERQLNIAMDDNKFDEDFEKAMSDKKKAGTLSDQVRSRLSLVFFLHHNLTL
jgi:hypothetical protein